VLEDNRTYDKVQETHPQWVDNGFIYGIYLEVWDLGYKVKAGDRFSAKVGFIKNANAGNVKFHVMIRPESREGGTQTPTPFQHMILSHARLPIPTLHQ
jgi:hypothetical protein